MDSYNEKDIDYALQVLAHPEQELTPEFKAWIRDKQHRELYRDLQAAYDVMALNENAQPDVQAEWERFQSRSSRFTPPPGRF